MIQAIEHSTRYIYHPDYTVTREEIPMNVELKLTGTSPEELAAEALRFAELLDKTKLTPAPVPAPPVAVPTPPVPAPPPAPAAPAPVIGIPTAAPSYTLDQLTLAIAAFADLSDANRDSALRLLQRFNIDQLQKLPPERYAEFALELRQLGAQI